jgi:DNA-binding transcriptional ArsR family regulator
MNKGMEQARQDFDTVNRKAELLKVLSHPMRLCIVRGLLGEGSCNVTSMQECLGIPQSTISQHLARLRTAGVIVGTRDGVEVYYKVVSREAERVIRALFS